MTTTLSVKDRQYSIFTFVNDEGEDVSIPELNPLECKMFSGDVIFERKVVSSPVRVMQNIPGILILENNRTYGRTENKKKLFYKCKPFSTTYPDFLVPYSIQMGFQKNFKNKYVTFRFESWEEKHPIGMLMNSIGDVHDLPSFYEYLLFCKNLHNPITPFIKLCKTILSGSDQVSIHENIINNNPERFGQIENLRATETFVFSIDPDGCTDRDDALSIQKDGDDYLVNVYISNVFVWLEALDLWDFLGTRVATIYLPDSKRNMLPTTISDLCSLDENTNKFAFVIKLFVKKNDEGFEIDDSKTTINQCAVLINKSFVYEEHSLLKNKFYKELFRVSTALDRTVTDSHELVSFWMMQTNTRLARKLRSTCCGVYRKVKCGLSASLEPHPVPGIRIWEQKVVGSYISFSENMDASHEMLGVSEYVHFTSPIRRMVDVINQVLMVQRSEVVLSDHARTFVESSLGGLSDLNIQMKNIQKVQSECVILDRVVNDTQFDGDAGVTAIVLAKLDDHRYSVYVPSLSWMSTVYSLEECVKNTELTCRVYIFEGEDKLRRKIRLEVLKN
jgi:hypothetical protein